jgi:hypothetical protein
MAKPDLDKGGRMKTLVVIPSLHHKYTFSAPLAWLLSHQVDKVHGVYSFSLSRDLVRQFDRFIVELNWYIELYEFKLIAAFIRKHKPHAPILFGGLYSQLKYREILDSSAADCCIKGDAEAPIQAYVEGADPKTIPNMVGRDFDNPQTFVFQSKDYAGLEFNLDWFPDYAKRWEEFPDPGADVDTDFSRMPLYPKYWEKPGRRLPPGRQWRVPPKGGRYHLPMLISARGSCPAAHKGCEYCMGAKNLSQALYRRPPLILDNSTCISLLRKIEKRFRRVALYINSSCTYDFSGQHFDLEATIEIDSRSTVDDAARMLPAFRVTSLHTAVYRDGLIGTELRSNLQEYARLEDVSHKVYFFAFPEDAKNLDIPAGRRLYAELVLPHWTHWDFYNDTRKALARSRDWYFATGQVNLFPIPRQIIMRGVHFLLTRIAYLLHRLKIVDLKKKLVV